MAQKKKKSEKSREHFMRSACNEAVQGIKKNHGGPFGAVIVRKGKIIAQAHNTVLKTNDPTAHAEINAIRKASKKLKRFHLPDCTLYTTAQPCPMCYAACQWAHIKKIYYGCTYEDTEKIGFKDKEFSGKKKITLKPMARQQCLQIFNKWKKKKGKRMY